MNPYRRYVLPRLIELAMNDRDLARIRAQVVPRAHGAVVELGVGSGLNLEFYSPRVTRVYGVDPSLELQKIARSRVPSGLSVEFLAQSAAERLPLESGSIDSAVVTWSLCSIDDPLAALSEVSRVLKPGGELHFVEHGLSPDAGVRRWQRSLDPLWTRVAGGCHMNRPIDELIRGAGLALRELEMDYALPGPRMLTYTYRGSASPARLAPSAPSHS